MGLKYFSPMTTLAGLFFTSFIVAFSGALMPGPLLTATISESSRYGPKAGPLLMVGHGILEITLVVLLFLGLAPLLTAPKVTAIISLVGGGILLWLAFGMFRSLPTLSLAVSEASHKRRGRLIASGIFISLSNPYWTIWWATIGLAYILQARNFGYLGIALFFIGHILADFAWYAAVSFAIGKGRRFFTPKVYKILVGACAAFLAVFAGIFLVHGGRSF
jgi:threonine/homoserine/homoserine lactone efflux protein